MPIEDVTNEKGSGILERYVSATTAFYTGLITGAEYVLQDLLDECEDIFRDTKVYHELHKPILDLLAKICLTNKDYDRANQYLDLLLTIDPDNIRAYFRLFELNADSFVDEKEALKVYMKACEVIERKGKTHLDYTLFNAMKIRGESIKRKRSTYLMLDSHIDLSENLFKKLPIEIFERILKLLVNRDKINLLLVCKGWRAGILSSPQLISQFSIPGFLTTNKILSFARVFDQMSPLEEIMLKRLRIDLNHNVKVLKVLLSSKIRCKSLFLVCNDPSKNYERVLVENNGSLFLKNLQELHITVNNNGCLTFLCELLSMCNNVRLLNILLKFTSITKEEICIDKKLFLPYVDEVRWQSVEHRGEDTSKFIENMQIDNVNNVTIRGSSSHGCTLLRKLKKLTSIKFASVNVHILMKVLFEPDGVNTNDLETLIIESCPKWALYETIPGKMLPRLKHLRIDSSNIFHDEFSEIYNRCRGTLENIEICGQIFGVNSNGFDDFDIKRVITDTPNLKKFILNAEFKPEVIANIAIQIATGNKMIKLDYLSLNSSLLKSQDWIMFILLSKPKLIVNEISIHLRYKNELNEYLEQAISEGKIKKINWIL